MKKMILAMCVFASVTAFADDGKLLYVRQTQENLRIAPKGMKIGILNQGAKLNVLEEQGQWVKVSVEGWIWKASTSDHKISLKSNPSTKLPNQIDGLLIPTISRKRYDSQDYQDYIWFDVTWDTSKLPKPTRAVKGTLIFSDLFGEPHFKIGWIINDPMKPGVNLIEKGVGFKFNQFIDSHQWMLSTDIKDMTVSFKIKSIIYQDGTRVTK